jgi:hypothetical protein
VSTAKLQLEAGGLLPITTTVDAGATEQIVARAYRHPALAGRLVIRLASDRLGEAEDLAMEFLGFEPPVVSGPIALQQRRSLGFAAWALINDPGNARFALDLVKRMKAAARQARSKPGHAWDAYTEMAKELGRSARHFLPPFWEEAGRAFKDLGNQTYAGRALTKSLEAERVHALPSDRARRRDVVLEFVLSGCLSGNALSEYGNDLQTQYPPQEAFAIFRDFCVRRTRGGMAPWATLPKDFIKLAKAAKLDGDQELEAWLEEVIDAPAMGRPPHQFWKTCSGHCKRIVSRNPIFAVTLLRHTRPEFRYYGESKLGPWFEWLEEWGVFNFLWEDQHQGAPPLGEPIAVWFGRIVPDEIPAPDRTLEMLEKLSPRLRKENVPLPLAPARRYGTSAIDIDVLEACLVLGIKVADPPPNFSVTFSGWLSSNVTHAYRNQDVVESGKDERFQSAIFQGLQEALGCRGGIQTRGYRQSGLEQRPFPLSAGDRPGIKALWYRHALEVISRLEGSGLVSFETALARLASTLWPDTLRLFPDVAERLRKIDPATVLRRTLSAGVFDEFGLPTFEEVVDRHKIKVRDESRQSNVHLTFPSIVVTDRVHAYVIGDDGEVKQHELRLPKKSELLTTVVVGDDLAVIYRDEKYEGHLFWVSDPARIFDSSPYYFHQANRIATAVNGGVFIGQHIVHPGDKQVPPPKTYFHDGSRFWRLSHEYHHESSEHLWKLTEVDPQTGKEIRKSVPPWFEETEGGKIEFAASELMLTPVGAENSPLGTKGRMLGWKAIKRRDGSYIGLGIDGRCWDMPLLEQDGSFATPVALLSQPGTKDYLPVTTDQARSGSYSIWDPSGSTIVAALQDFGQDYANGQVTILPLPFWHLLKVRDEASSKKLRGVSLKDCGTLLKAAAEDRNREKPTRQSPGNEPPENPLTTLIPIVKKLLPKAPERLVIGVARVVERTEREAAIFDALREKAHSDSTRPTATSSITENRKSDLGATHWGLETYSISGEEGRASVTENLLESAEFLKGNSPAGELSTTRFLWFPMLENLPLRCWKTYWRVLAVKLGQKDNSEVPWLEFLKSWHESGIADLPGQIDLMDGYPEGAKKRSWGGYDVNVIAGRSFTIQNGDDRFIMIEHNSYNFDQMPYRFLRYSTAKKPGPPPGYKVQNVRAIKSKAKPGQIEAFIAAAESSTKPPLPAREELEGAAARLSITPAELGLIWMGGLNLDSYEHNFLPAGLRTMVGWKATDASVARQALRNLKPEVRERLLEAVVAQGCAAPFSDDCSPVLLQLENAWRAEIPKRLPLEAALQTRLSTLGRSSRWQRADHGEFLAVAADPTLHPLLQTREIAIGVDKSSPRTSLVLAAKDGEPVIDGNFLRSVVQLVALVHGETPAGHPARLELPALIKQVTRLLEHSGTLLRFRSLYIYDQGPKNLLKPIDWLNKHVGKTRADAKAETVSVDDGLIVGVAQDGQAEVVLGFRPAKLKDIGDLARLQGLLSRDVGESYELNNDVVPLVLAIKSPGFQKLARAMLAKGVAPGVWLENPLQTAPTVVQEIQTKCKLGEDAAVLYAQLLALPEPTTANLCTWNGWTAGRLKKASAELVERKLVLEAARSRSGRPLFLPGEWVELKAPWLPIERWKLAHLVELEKYAIDAVLTGGPLVLRPFEDLFAAAWQRIVSGDEPRYEDVKRKKKTK